MLQHHVHIILDNWKSLQCLLRERFSGSKNNLVWKNLGELKIETSVQGVWGEADFQKIDTLVEKSDKSKNIKLKMGFLKFEKNQ